MLTVGTEHAWDAACPEAHRHKWRQGEPWPGAVGWARDGRTSLATGPAAAQLPSEPLHASAPSCPPAAQPQARATGACTSRGWTPTSSLQNVRQKNSEGKRTSAFSAFPTPVVTHSRKTEAWHAVCPHCQERLPREPSGEPRPSSPHLQTRCSADDVAELTSSAFRTRHYIATETRDRRSQGLGLPKVAVGGCRPKSMPLRATVILEREHQDPKSALRVVTENFSQSLYGRLSDSFLAFAEAERESRWRRPGGWGLRRGRAGSSWVWMERLSPLSF